MRVLFVAALVGLVLATGARAGGFYLKIDGIEGEVGSVSTGQLALSSLSLAHSKVTSAYASGSMTLAREPDALSATLIRARVQDERFPVVEVGLGTRTYCLGDAGVTKVSDSGGSQPSESLTLNFSQVHITYGSGGCSRGKDPVVVAFTGTSAGTLHARVDCLTRKCVGLLAVTGVGKATFSLAGGRSRALVFSAPGVQPGAVEMTTLTLEGSKTAIVERSVVPAAPAPVSSAIFTCPVAGTQGVAISVTGNAPAAAGGTASIVWTAPSGRTSSHHASVAADGSFVDSLTPDEAGTWTGVATAGAATARCSISVAATVG